MIQLPLSPDVGARVLTQALLRLRLLGGPGSGNFGHSGRPGEVGGSSGERQPQGDEEDNDLKARTFFHGTHSLSVQDILQQGLLVGHAGKMWPSFSSREHTYITTDHDNAEHWAESAVQKMKIDHRDAEIYPVILTVRVPPEYARRVVQDSHFPEPGSPARQFKGNIHPSWIIGAKMGAWDDDADGIVWKDVSRSSPMPRAAADADTIIHIVLLLTSKKLRTAGGPGSGNFGHSGRPGQVGGSSSALTDSTTHPADMSFEQFQKPVPLPPVPEGHIRLSHVTSAENVPNILREGLKQSKSKGASYGEPSVVWATTHGETWGGALDANAREIIFDMPTKDVSSAGTLHRMADVPPEAIVSVERAGFSDVSTGALTLRQERKHEDLNTRRQYWEAYQREKPKSPLPFRPPGVYDEKGRLIAPVQSQPHARPSGPWDMNRAAGGPGSGNFGHSGRPGQVGGSTSGDDARIDNLESFDKIQVGDYTVRRDMYGMWVVYNDHSHAAFEDAQGAKLYLRSKQTAVNADPHTLDVPVSIYHNSPDQFAENKPTFGAYFGDEHFLKAFPNEWGEHTYKVTLPKGSKVLDLGKDTPEAREFMATVAGIAYPKDPGIADWQARLRQGDPAASSYDEFYEAWTDKKNILGALKQHKGYDAVRYQSEYVLPPETLKKLKGTKLKTAEVFRTLGGSGSGNFGHAGRPGEVGGSVTEGGPNGESEPLHAGPRIGFVTPTGQERVASKTSGGIGGYGEDHTDLARRLMDDENGGVQPALKQGYLRYWVRNGEIALNFKSGQPNTASNALRFIKENVQDGDRIYLDIEHPHGDNVTLGGFFDNPREANQAIRRAGGLKTLGGPGSGNFGHTGRPGEVGGSSGGELGPRPTPIKVSKVKDAIPLILQGKVVELPNVRKVNVLMQRLAKIAKDAKRQGKDAPSYDACQIVVPGSNIFCGQHLVTKEYPNGMPRIVMPQFASEPIPGTPADKLPRDAKGVVDAGPEFIDHLASRGITSTRVDVPSASLRPSQAQLDGPKIAKRMVQKDYRPSSPIFISRDGYIVDGHHRWAAVVGRDAEDGHLGDSTIRAYKIDAPISEILNIAKTWTKTFGLEQKGIGRAAGGPGSGNFGHSGRPGEVGGSSSEGGSAVTKSTPFKRWFKQSKVVDAEGKPLVVYHGTTHDFDTFEPAGSDKYNIESDFGAAAYFSNSASDVSENYAGVGPDLTSRLEQRADQLTSENDELDHEAALKQAREELVGRSGALGVPVYLSMQNPFVLGDAYDEDHPVKETYLTHEYVYDDPNDPDSDIVGEEGTLVDFITALKDEAGQFHDTEGVDDFLTKLADNSFDGMHASELDKLWRTTETTAYVTDDQGRLAGNELYRRALERAGFDGVIDRSVDTKFGSARRIGKQMIGVTADTEHYIVFKPQQIKSAIGNRKFNPKSPVITLGGPGSGNFGHAGRPGEVGGSGVGDSTAHLPESVAYVLRAREQKLKELDYEAAAILSPTGEVVNYISSYAKDYITIDEKLKPSLADTIFTHNHPGSNGLSLADGDVAVNLNIREIRAIGADGRVHSLRREGDRWPDNFMALVRVADYETQKTFSEEIRAGHMTMQEANAKHYDHVYATAVAKIPGVAFVMAPSLPVVSEVHV